jgi:predicted ATPase
MTRTTWTAQQVAGFYSGNPQLVEQLNRELSRFDVGISAMQLKEVGADLVPWFIHEALAAPIWLNQESSGTQHFVTIFPILNFVLAAGHIGVFDEFDADLHPDLVRELFSWFHSPERNPLGGQIFVTLHNAALLDFLEKEEVFFVQKGPAGGTEVYGARDIKGLRRGPSMYKKYMGGELGALPRIG